jgi:hypothetical protein
MELRFEIRWRLRGEHEARWREQEADEQTRTTKVADLLMLMATPSWRRRGPIIGPPLR